MTDDTTQTELAPCPSCKSTLGPFVTTQFSKRQVICSTCGTCGPFENVVKTTEELWNELPRHPTTGERRWVMN